jgi:tRNA-splicing ligase RtcB
MSNGVNKIIKTEKIPIMLWLDDIEEGALRQAKNIANHPFAFHHVAIMPDAHEGYGMPIGGVLAAKDIIIPNAVGVDIGCGVCAQKTSLKAIEIGALKKIMGGVRENVPLGFNRHKKAQDEKLMPEMPADAVCVKQEWDTALKSLGTLGGGNHFIEIQKDGEGHIWIMLHCGSRNLGKKTADYYNKLAIEHTKKKNQPELIKQELAYLPFNSETGQRYFNEMNFCLNYALANRKLIMERIKRIISEIAGKVEFTEFTPYKKKPLTKSEDRKYAGTNSLTPPTDDTSYTGFINIAHNYASKENHFENEVIVHRKGATKAEKGRIGIVPGSQGSKSYIVEGLGNKDSYNSCSHGAGRKMGRRQAIRQLNLEEEVKRLDEKGILHAIRGKRDLDEASGAYKDIGIVMKNQEDLVKIITTLSPIAVIKG